MIEANELRIGNLVKSLFTYVIVKEIYQDNKIAILYESGKQEVLSIKDFEPIPLTPEILEGCGFKETIFTPSPNKEGRRGYLMPVGWHWYLLQKCSDSSDIIRRSSSGYEFLKFTKEDIEDIGLPINYLHELQNFYFALFRTELETNLWASILANEHR